jgi:uncharacterized membrane protein
VLSGLVQLGGGAPGRWLLVVLLALASPAFAQLEGLGVAKEVANGTVAYALAVACFLLICVVIYLFRAWREEVAGRREDAKVATAEAKAAARSHHAETVETLTSVITINLKSVEAVESLEKLSDRYTEERS